MEQKDEFNVKKEGENVVLTHTITKTMNKQEALRELRGIKQSEMQLKQARDKHKKYIEEKTFDKEYKNMLDSLSSVKKLHSDLDKTLEVFYKSLENEFTKEIKVKKAKKGYNRIKDNNQKILFRSQVLSELCNDNDVDVNDPFVAKLRNNFDKI